MVRLYLKYPMVCLSVASVSSLGNFSLAGSPTIVIIGSRWAHSSRRDLLIKRAMGSMKHFLFLIVAALVCVPAMGQSVTLQTGADLFERPDASGPVRMSLPAGIELSVLSEQGDWLAVSTSTGIVGWVQRPGNEAAGEDNLDDLLRSIDEASADTPAPSPPVATPAPAPAPPPTQAPGASPSEASTPPPTTVAPPAATPSSTAPPPPPPPSARPRSMDGDVSFGTASPPNAPFTNVAAGFYDKYQWITAALDLKEEYKRLDLQYNKLLGGITQLGAWLSGTDGFIQPDFGGEGALSKGAATETCPCGDIKTVQGGLRLNLYPVVATADRPYGAYLGGFLGGGTFAGEDAPESVNIATLGGELGLFAKFGSPRSPQWIPSAAIQIARTEFICGSETGFCGFDPETLEPEDHIGDSSTTVRFGLEMNYHGLVPGVHVTLLESPDPEKSFETLFGFGFTVAY